MSTKPTREALIMLCSDIEKSNFKFIKKKSMCPIKVSKKSIKSLFQ